MKAIEIYGCCRSFIPKQKFPYVTGNTVQLILEDDSTAILDNMSKENLKELLRTEQLAFPLDITLLDKGHCVLVNLPNELVQWCTVYVTEIIASNVWGEFVFRTVGGNKLQVRNMTHNKLKSLLDEGLTYPIQIRAFGGSKYCEIVDVRIDPKHYSTFY